MFPSIGRQAGRNRHRTRLLVRLLEERTVPAQLVVTSSADSGPGSVRDVLSVANGNGEADTITFDPSVTKITLTTGHLTISEGTNLTVDGGGATITGSTPVYSIGELFNVSALGQPSISFSNITL